jgi:saccharopine dehydrogenase-like NADP-dependent oxidoreductase
MRIGILGAGAEGSGLAALLAREGDVEAIRFGDIDERRLGLAVSRVEALGARVDGSSVDGTDDHAVAHWAQDLGVVFNATAPPCNLATMRGALHAGAHYLDMNSGPFDIPGVIPRDQTIDAQFELSEAFAAAGLTAISCCGVAPGWVDLIARYASDQLDTIDSVIVRWVEWNDGRELISTVGPFLIANFNMPRPICWHEGRIVDVDLRESEELYEWPEPIGAVPLFTGFLQPELRTIQNIGREIRHIEVKSGLSNGRWRSSPEIWIEALRRQLAEGAAADVADLPRRLGARSSHRRSTTVRSGRAS